MKLKIFTDKMRGFTLIEMLVTISIMLLLTGGGIAAFINFNDRQKVQVAAKEIKTLLRSAQIKAKTGEGASDCTNSSLSLQGYRVSADVTNRVTLSSICADSKFYTESSKALHTRTTIELDNNLTVNEFAIDFLSLLGGVNLNSGDGFVRIYGTDGTYVFIVTDSGEITEGDYYPIIDSEIPHF